METKQLREYLNAFHQKTLTHFSGEEFTQNIPCAVCVLFIQQPNGTGILLTQRAAHLKHHAAQISFPGGRVDETDIDIIATALRETEEEIGLAAKDIEIIGALSPLITRTGFIVTPVMGLVQSPYDLLINHEEVTQVLEIPLTFISQQAHFQIKKEAQFSRPYPWVEVTFENYHIFGLTAQILYTIGGSFFTQR